MGQNWLEDYMKFKGITPLGIIMYPIIATVVGILLVYIYIVNIIYWIQKKIRKKRR